MYSKVVVTGTGCLSDFAQTSSELLNNLAQGKFVNLQPVFENKMLKSLFGFEHDVKYAPLENARKELSKKYKSIENEKVAALVNVTEQVLADAKLDAEILAQKSTRVFWGSSGNHPDLISFIRELHSNAAVDLLLNKKITDLHADSFRNDTLTQPYAEYFKLPNPILTVSSACSSALNAMIPAIAMLQSGEIDRALVLSWQEVSKFDILFMSGLNIMAKQASLPFSKDSDGLMPAYGVAGILLERLDDTHQSQTPNFAIKAMSSKRALSGSAHSASLDVSFRSISQTMQDALDKAGVLAEDVDLIYPHGNGITASDQSEASALSQLFSSHKAKIVSYTEQTGYMLSASGGFDLILANDAFKNNRIIPMRSKGNLDLTLDMNFVFEECQADIQYLLKNSIGIDGSIVSCLLERVDHA
ncbi:beta-ketoacyl synthase N-terminal-like domain-containing protein [Pseudomonas sp. HK3]